MDFLFRGLYSVIYCYSCVEIWVVSNIKSWGENAVIKKVCDYAESIYDHYYPSVQQYLFVENGCQTIIYKTADGDIYTLKTMEPKEYDFILRNDYINRKNYKIIYDRVDYITPYYEISNVSFLSFLVHYKNIDIEIELDTKQYTYMIVGNRINKKFIFYLLKNMGFAKEEFDKFDYSLQILTQHDVNFLNLTSSDEIVIMKNHLK